MLADDLAIEIEDEYNPMIPNNYEKVVRERREEHDRIREEEVIYCLLRQTSNIVLSSANVEETNVRGSVGVVAGEGLMVAVVIVMMTDHTKVEEKVLNI